MLQWRIQDCQDKVGVGEGQLQGGGAPTYSLVWLIFPEHCMKMNQIVPGGGGGKGQSSIGQHHPFLGQCPSREIVDLPPTNIEVWRAPNILNIRL